MCTLVAADQADMLEECCHPTLDVSELCDVSDGQGVAAVFM